MSSKKPKQGYKIVNNFFRDSFEIPKDWDYPKFHEVVKTNPLTKIDEENVPYIPMAAVDVSKPHFNYFDERILSENSSLAKFQENDVLFARITPSTENGKTCIVENFPKKGIVSSELTVLRPTKFVFPKYLYYYVKSERIRQFAISQMSGSTGRQRVPDYVFKKDLNFELPSFLEQQKIAIIFSNIDNLINSYDQIIEQTKRLKKGLMQKLLTKGIGHKKFKKIKSLFKKSDIIPENWGYTILDKLTPLNDKSSIRMGPFGSNLKTHELLDSGKIKTLWIENIVHDAFSFEHQKFITEEKFYELKGFQVKPDDVLITMMGTLGKVAIVPDDIGDAIISSHLLKITLDHKKLIPIFLFYFLKSHFISRQIIKESRGLVMGGLNTGIIKNLFIKTPSVPEQEKIVSVLVTVDSKISELQSKQISLNRLKNGLMQKLLTGQIRV